MTDLLVRAGGLAAALWGALVLGLIGAFLTPYRIGSILIPVALVVAALGNWLLLRFTYDATGNPWLSLLPGGVWLAVSLVLSSRTAEGDLVLTQQNWVATVYLFVGSLAIGIPAYRMITGRPPAPLAPPPSAPPPSAPPSGPPSSPPAGP